MQAQHKLHNGQTDHHPAQYDRIERERIAPMGEVGTEFMEHAHRVGGLHKSGEYKRGGQYEAGHVDTPEQQDVSQGMTGHGN